MRANLATEWHAMKTYTSAMFDENYILYECGLWSIPNLKRLRNTSHVLEVLDFMRVKRDAHNIGTNCI